MVTGLVPPTGLPLPFISAGSTSTSKPTIKTNKVQENTEYIAVDAETMLKTLNDNALKAEKTYQDTYVEVKGYISNIDSDGKYISIDSNNLEYFLINIQCEITNEKQLNVVMDKSIGDEVIVKGKITDIGEIMGYMLDIHEIK